MRTSTARGLAVLASLAPALGHAAEMTDVADAFDTANNNPIDFRFEPTFRSETSSGVISRENICQTPGCAQTVFNRELEFERARSVLDTTLKLGVGLNFELHGRLPVVFGDQTNLKFANDVDETNSRVDPSDARIAADLAGGNSDPNQNFFGSYRFFDVQTQGDGTKRSGTGDPTIGFAWSPLESTEAEPWGTLVFGFDYTLPMGKVRTADNDAVGRGVHNFAFSLAASRPVAAIEPFFTFQFDLPLPATDSPYRNLSSDQSLIGPGPKFETTLGTEVTMFKDAASHQSYTLGLGMRYGYQFAGREWTPLSDAFANSGCNDLTPLEAGMSNDADQGPDGNAYNPAATVDPELARCGWVLQAPGNAVDLDNYAGAKGTTKFAFDGLSDVEGFGIVGGNIALNLQFSEWAELRITSDVIYETSHFLTNANSGKSSGGGDDSVELDPTQGERNPFYNTAIDAQGSRFRSDGSLRVNWGATFAILL